MLAHVEADIVLHTRLLYVASVVVLILVHLLDIALCLILHWLTINVSLILVDLWQVNSLSSKLLKVVHAPLVDRSIVNASRSQVDLTLGKFQLRILILQLFFFLITLESKLMWVLHLREGGISPILSVLTHLVHLTIVKLLAGLISGNVVVLLRDDQSLVCKLSLNLAAHSIEQFVTVFVNHCILRGHLSLHLLTGVMQCWLVNLVDYIVGTTLVVILLLCDYLIISETLDHLRIHYSGIGILILVLILMTHSTLEILSLVVLHSLA